MDTPTTAPAALAAYRTVRAAMDELRHTVPAEWRAVLPWTGPVVGGRRAFSERFPDVDGIPLEMRSEWSAPPLLLTTSDPDRLPARGVFGPASVALVDTSNEVAYSRVYRNPSFVARRPRIAVWHGESTPATPRGTHMLATAAVVARQAADLLTPSSAGHADQARQVAGEERAYLAFADAVEASLPASLTWLHDPAVSDLLDAYDGATATPARPVTAATPYGYATAGPSDRSRNNRGRF